MEGDLCQALLLVWVGVPLDMDMDRVIRKDGDKDMRADMDRDIRMGKQPDMDMDMDRDRDIRRDIRPDMDQALRRVRQRIVRRQRELLLLLPLGRRMRPTRHMRPTTARIHPMVPMPMRVQVLVPVPVPMQVQDARPGCR